MLEEWIKENVKMECQGAVAVVRPEIGILPPRAFSDMPGLRKVVLPDGLLKIGDCSFSGSRNLVQVCIPPRVVLIDDGAFKGCSSITEIQIPDGVVGIGSMAFAGTGIKEIRIPGNIRYVDRGAFAACPNLEKVIWMPRTEKTGQDTHGAVRDNFPPYVADVYWNNGMEGTFFD